MCVVLQKPAQQAEVGQPVAAQPRETSAAEAPVQLGQHARGRAVQHPQPSHRAAQDLERRGHGTQEFSGGFQLAW